MDNLPKNTNLIPPNPQIEVESLRPFTQFCLSIGAIPSSYKTALTVGITVFSKKSQSQSNCSSYVNAVL